MPLLVLLWFSLPHRICTHLSRRAPRVVAREFVSWCSKVEVVSSKHILRIFFIISAGKHLLCRLLAIAHLNGVEPELYQLKQMTRMCKQKYQRRGAAVPIRRTTHNHTRPPSRWVGWVGWWVRGSAGGWVGWVRLLQGIEQVLFSGSNARLSIPVTNFEANSSLCDDPVGTEDSGAPCTAPHELKGGRIFFALTIRICR